ncbi:solute carrier family 2, facilitated glucose transporter member 8-like [Vanessa atalanta]|uniref:solute carrier family 2, facilitated glucose transporter member 8-like n=1 Tax=Vanessa atalanta TaxID=42275 RepID=UPI001FCDAAA2|nr:solute carrier family 2, facilitated glucose transporter member 8-like [Vanessa atalanta]
MTVKSPWALLANVRGAVNQILLVFLINVPTMSFGLALGWVSLASGEAGAADAAGSGGGEEAGRGAVIAAVTTFTASLVGVPLSARALDAGRKAALIATSSCFVVCWSLKLASVWGGAWCVVVARVAAGLGGAAAWALAPLLAREMCSKKYQGAAVSALALAHNFGVLLMYLAADAAIPHRTILWWCLGLSVTHCVIFAFVPESPSFLAAKGKMKEAYVSLAWFRGVSVSDPALETELRSLPPPERDQSSWSLAKEMLSDPQRRRAFIIGAVAVIGQEACGVLAILQYAERVFVLARDETEREGSPRHPPPAAAPTDELMSPARHAVVIGAVQLVMSALSLYLVERIGRRPLLVVCAVLTGAALALAAVLTGVTAVGATAAIAVAVAADSAGLQPAPYALLADMFHYQYRSCAQMLVTAGGCAGNALEVALFPLAAAGGLRGALALAAALTLAYALFAALLVPETRGRTPEQIYAAVGPARPARPSDCEYGPDSKCSELAMCTKLPLINMSSLKIMSVSVGEAVAGLERDCDYFFITDYIPSYNSSMGLLDKLSAWIGGGGTQVTVLVLGLDSSGKTSTLNAMRPPEQRVSHTLPTVGHQQDHFQSGGVSFSAWDVSGAARMRPLWERHYRHAHAVIFVVDSADHLRLVVAREELELMLAHPDMFGRRAPLLVLANKSDAPHALSAAHVAAGNCMPFKLTAQQTGNIQKCFGYRIFYFSSEHNIKTAKIAREDIVLHDQPNVTRLEL